MDNKIIIQSENIPGMISSSMERISLYFFQIFDEKGNKLGEITGDALNTQLHEKGFKIVNK